MSAVLAWKPTVWHASHGHDSFADFEAHLREADHDRLAAVAANTLLNDWCGDVADYSENDKRGSGKRLPYIGWYWRSVDFAAKSIPVGDCGEFIGFMENNKWGYSERDLTPDEADHAIALLWKAREESNRGGLVSDLYDARDAVLTELWDWMQTLTVTP